MWSVFFVFLSYLDRNLVRADLLSRALEKESKEMFSLINGTFCAKMSTVTETFLFQVSDGAQAVRSAVSPAGRLLGCSVTADQEQVDSFMQECRLGLKQRGAERRMETPFTHMEEAKEMCRDFTERAELQEKVPKRSKRGFTYPGTLWCGAGNMADHYDQLGEFAETDSCCRIHDHCPNVIHAFSSKYGHTNFKWHSICHCDCDNALKACLRKVNDTSSRVVGQAFFNVIGVPCFEFDYEEQCAERTWYGVCKRYEKFPMAVLKEAVPYDFGGIDVIDKLTLAPPTRKDSKKNPEDEKPESTTQSSMSGPEEPSLGNVVTAAEDFIKVLATVSTSQSSAADSDKAETQSSEKKKRKNKGKKKKTKKQRAKERKRKQKEETGGKREEGASVSTSAKKENTAVAFSNFISESHKHNRVPDREYELRGKEEPSNEVMKDEPASDKEPVSVTTPMTEQKKTAESDLETTQSKNRELRRGRRKMAQKVPLSSPRELVRNTTENLRDSSAATIPPAARPLQQSSDRVAERRAVLSTARTPFVISKVKRTRSKEREGRKKRRKVSSASPIQAVAHESSSTDSLNVIPLSAATEPPLSVGLDSESGKMNLSTTALNSSFSVLKKQKSKARGLRSRRRKTVLSESPLFYNNSEHLLPFLPAPDSSNALSITLTTAAAVSRHTEAMENQRQLFTTTPPVVVKSHRQTQKALPGSLSRSVPEQTEQTPVTLRTTPSTAATTSQLGLQRSETPSKTASAPFLMSPLQLTMEKAKAQFIRKKRRKAAALFTRGK